MSANWNTALKQRSKHQNQDQNQNPLQKFTRTLKHNWIPEHYLDRRNENSRFSFSETGAKCYASFKRLAQRWGSDAKHCQTHRLLLPRPHWLNVIKSLKNTFSKWWLSVHLISIATMLVFGRLGVTNPFMSFLEELAKLNFGNSLATEVFNHAHNPNIVKLYAIYFYLSWARESCFTCSKYSNEKCAV